MTVSANKVGQFDESPVIFGLEPVVSVMQSGLNIRIDAGTLAGQIVFIRFFQVEDGTHASRHRDGRNMFLFLAGLTVGVSAITFDECLSEAVTSKACILQGIQCFLLQVDFLGHD
ncbi:hypothetical protein [Bifidobacterium longum]|uniref:hypothetical protein n=1 Tax=Bifidobacterium longum TaxID=216816 RepID=UPI00103CF83C|nr:hypothetical protein [Bifidobacterium longum]